ncbi:hypothetical protein DV515_00012617 [Chloebia gouldiae]|uniref:Uncharacterized protein n=1 Tax=Chloebia gouldiae TaxID=44316 RepID=A0A3L8S4D6_CHLGU|nr:hypothetical protein DV515_00012617 [Chloebia gouldiae]
MTFLTCSDQLTSMQPTHCYDTLMEHFCVPDSESCRSKEPDPWLPPSYLLKVDILQKSGHSMLPLRGTVSKEYPLLCVADHNKADPVFLTRVANFAISQQLALRPKLLIAPIELRAFIPLQPFRNAKSSPAVAASQGKVERQETKFASTNIARMLHIKLFSISYEK